MGSVLFDFLSESVLFDAGHIESRFAHLGDDEVADVLRRYREFCLERSGELVAEAVGVGENFRVFPGIHRVQPHLLEQSALYVGRYVLSDPLLPLTEQEKPFDRAMRSYFGQKGPRAVDRARLTDVVAGLKQLTPMVAANYVKFVPASHLFEAPENLPLYYSETRFSEVLPSDLLTFFHQNKSIQTLRRDGTGWVADPDNRVSRCIAVDFGDDESAGMVYQLLQSETKRFDTGTSTLTARMTLPDSPPAQAEYDSWVEQSINRTAINFYDRLRTELALSDELGASYLCFSEFRNELLTRFFPVRASTPEHTARVVLQLNLPFLDAIDAETLMKVRRDECEAFQVFRNELERQFWDLRAEEDPERLRTKADKVLHELGTVQKERLDQKLKQVCRGSLAKAAVLSATLGATIMSGHYLVALAGAAAGAYQIRAENIAALRQNPAFFLWKVRRAAARAGRSRSGS